MLVTVTAEHIACGQRGKSHGCPIALAIREAGYRVTVDEAMVVFLGGKSASLPLTARAFINNFDHDRPVEPFSFEIGEPL